MKHVAAVFVVACIASSAFAAKADFSKGPAQYLLTKDELAEWKSVQTDEQAEDFIDAFWARRDPSPGTPANEFRDGFNERVKIADSNFATARVPGSATDRGKVFVLLGAPTKLRKSDRQAGTVQGPPTGMPANLGAIDMRANQSVQGYSPKELWIYEQGKSEIKLGQPLVEIAFIDQYGSNDWKLDRVPNTDPVAVFDNVARTFLVDASAAPVVARTVSATPAYKTAAFATAAPSPNLFVSYGEFVTPAGEHFVPVQLYATAAADLAGGAKGTFFGRIEKASGEVMSIFEEPATLVATNGGAYIDATLTLTPGEYRGTFGFAGEGKAPVVVTTPISVAGLDKDASGVSALILSNHIYALTQAQAPTDAYAFGGLKVVPKSDRVFRKADELWYFFEIRNPGLDAATQAPKLMLRLGLTGTTAKGAAVKMGLPPEETPARELKGVPGHWAIGQAMPLESFQPGEYTLAVKVTDLVTKQSYEMQEKFRIVD